MRKNEITLQEMFSTIVEELRESGRWGTAHIYQASSNAFSAFTNYQALPLRKLSLRYSNASKTTCDTGTAAGIRYLLTLRQSAPPTTGLWI